MAKNTTVQRAALSAPEVATYLGIGRTAAYELMHAKGFPSFRIATGRGKGSMRVMRAALDRWVEEQSGAAI